MVRPRVEGGVCRNCGHVSTTKAAFFRHREKCTEGADNYRKVKAEAKAVTPSDFPDLDRAAEIERVLRAWREGEYGFGVLPTLDEINNALGEPDWPHNGDKADA